MQPKIEESEILSEKWSRKSNRIYTAVFDGFERIIKLDNGAYKWRVFGIINRGPIQFGSEQTLERAVVAASKDTY